VADPLFLQLHDQAQKRAQLSRTNLQLVVLDCLSGGRPHLTCAVAAVARAPYSAGRPLSVEGESALDIMAYCGTMDLPQAACRGGQDCSTSGRLPLPVVRHMHCSAGASRGRRQQTERSCPSQCWLSLDRRRVAVSAELEDRGGGQFPEMDEPSELRLPHRGPAPTPLPTTTCHHQHGSGSLADRPAAQ